MKYINKTRFFSLFCFIVFTLTLAFSYAQSVGSDISNAVIRLHIVANSNSEADQQLKLQVRDSILKNTDQLFGKTENPEEALQLATKNSEYIKSIAESEIRRLGYDYTVNVSTGTFSFPTKVYNNIALPAGKYNAVRVEIGSAQGENWWCVLYPPLCFTGETISISSKAESKLKSSLTDSEYQLITQENAPIKVKFKLVEIFRNLF